MTAYIKRSRTLNAKLIHYNAVNLSDALYGAEYLAMHEKDLGVKKRKI